MLAKRGQWRTFGRRVLAGGRSRGRREGVNPGSSGGLLLDAYGVSAVAEKARQRQPHTEMRNPTELVKEFRLYRVPPLLEYSNTGIDLLWPHWPAPDARGSNLSIYRCKSNFFPLPDET